MMTENTESKQAWNTESDFPADQPNSLNHTISIAGLKASYDRYVKNILSNKCILSWIMKCCIPDYSDMAIPDIEACIEESTNPSTIPVNPNETESIRGSNTEDNSITEQVIRYDVIFTALLPLTKEPIQIIINVEAQRDSHPGYPLEKRMIYYLSRMISSQYGTMFERSGYDRLRKVYSIWICSEPPRDQENSMKEITLMQKAINGHPSMNAQDIDLMTGIMICLGKPDGDNSNRILRLMDVLLSKEIGASRKKQILTEEFDIRMTRKADREVLEMCNLGEGVVEWALKRGEERGIAQEKQRGILSQIASYADSVRGIISEFHVDKESAIRIARVPEQYQNEVLSVL